MKRRFDFAIPDGTIVQPDGYALLDENDFNPGRGTLPTDFALSERGDELWLISAHPNGRPNRFQDRVEFGPSFNGVSLGNVDNIDDLRELQPLKELTFGEPNGSHRVGEVDDYRGAVSPAGR